MNRRIKLSAVILATALTGIMVLMGPVQDTGDDAMMAWQLSQGKGSLASFTSPFLSLAMNYLYQNFSQVPWWSLLHVLSAWVLLTVLLNEVKRVYPRQRHLILYLVIFSGVWFAVMRQVNFTRTAAAFALSGIILCLIYIFAKQNEESAPFCIYLVGVCLYFLGIMIRFQAGILILPFMLALLVLRKLEFLKRQKTIRTRAAQYGFAMLIIVTLLLAGMKTIFWNMNPEWKQYQEYSDARAAIVDYTEFYPSWEEAKEQYKAYGLKNENDLDILLSKAYIGEPEVYSIQTLQSVRGLYRKSTGAWAEMKAGLSKMKQMLTDGNILLWLLLLFLYMMSEKRRKQICLSHIVLLCIAGAILIYFSFAGRMVLRVWEPTLMCVLSLSVVYVGTCLPFDQSGRQKNRRVVNMVFLCAAVALSFHTGIIRNICNMKFPDKTDDRDEISRARAEYIQATPDRIYLLSQPLFHHPPTPGPFGIWEAIPQGYLENYFALSNWEANTPTNLNKLKQLGITNPTKALIQRSDTYSEFMDDKTFQFLKSHYGSSITCSFVDTFPDEGAIVQYTSPIQSVVEFPESENTITLTRSEANTRYQIKAWNIEGRISGWTKNADHVAMYCNIIKKDKQTYSFRLACDEGGYFFACFYDVDENWLRNVEKASLVELKTDGQYILVGMVEDTELAAN